MWIRNSYIHFRTIIFLFSEPIYTVEPPLTATSPQQPAGRFKHSLSLSFEEIRNSIYTARLWSLIGFCLIDLLFFTYLGATLTGTPIGSILFRLDLFLQLIIELKITVFHLFDNCFCFQRNLWEAQLYQQLIIWVFIFCFSRSHHSVDQTYTSLSTTAWHKWQSTRK